MLTVPKNKGGGGDLGACIINVIFIHTEQQMQSL